MVNSGMKKIVVIKDIPSNIVEEAILILKNEPGTATDGGKRKADCGVKKTREDFLVKEAELIINNYIKESKMEKGRHTEQEKSRSFLKNKFFTGFAINLALIGSLALFVFLLLQVM